MLHTRRPARKCISITGCLVMDVRVRSGQGARRFGLRGQHHHLLNEPEEVGRHLQRIHRGHLAGLTARGVVASSRSNQCTFMSRSSCGSCGAHHRLDKLAQDVNLRTKLLDSIEELNLLHHLRHFQLAACTSRHSHEEHELRREDRHCGPFDGTHIANDDGVVIVPLLPKTFRSCA
jgi:hypothetical protein